MGVFWGEFISPYSYAIQIAVFLAAVYDANFK
jgi:hypothetical protein